MDVQIYWCYLHGSPRGYYQLLIANQVQKDAPPWPNPIEMYEVSDNCQDSIWQLSGTSMFPKYWSQNETVVMKSLNTFTEYTLRLGPFQICVQYHATLFCIESFCSTWRHLLYT